jgi:hypothetical protein
MSTDRPNGYGPTICMDGEVRSQAWAGITQRIAAARLTLNCAKAEDD